MLQTNFKRSEVIVPIIIISLVYCPNLNFILRQRFKNTSTV